MSNNKQSMKLYTEEQLVNTIDAIRDYLKNYPEKFHESMIEKHLKNLEPIATKRTLIIYNTKETTEDEARHLLEILNCDDSTLWDNADHCGVQVLEVPIQGGNNEQTTDMTWDEYGNPKPIINGGDNMNNNPGNTNNNTMNMSVLREYITLYLNDISSYDDENLLTEATTVLNDFVLYVESMGVSISDDEQAMIDYNAMEDESESNDIREMQQ